MGDFEIWYSEMVKVGGSANKRSVPQGALVQDDNAYNHNTQYGCARALYRGTVSRPCRSVAAAQ